MEVKIKKLDAELGAFKSQMSKLRDGPGKVSPQPPFPRDLYSLQWYEGELTISRRSNNEH